MSEERLELLELQRTKSTHSVVTLIEDKPKKSNENLPVYTSTDKLKDLVCIALNISSAVGIVMSNKVVLSVYNFHYGTLLTVLHFVVTGIALDVMVYLGMFPSKPAPVLKVLPLCASFCGFVVLTNLSLQYNSVGVYQMVKVLTTPCVAMIQWSCYGVSFRLPVVMTLFVTCVGVVIATFTEVSLRRVGLFFALSAVLITAIYQVVLNHHNHRFIISHPVNGV